MARVVEDIDESVIHRHFGNAPTDSEPRDYGAGQLCRGAKHFAGGAARRAVNEAGITGWLQERNRGHLGRSSKSDDAAEVTADPSTALV